MRVRCSRAALASFPASSASSSAIHRPSFGLGWTSRSYANDVAPDRTTLRTVFRDTRRSRAISLIALPLRKYSRRIRPIVSTVSIPHYPRLIRRGQRITPHGRGGNFGRRYPRSGGQDCTPKHTLCTLRSADHSATTQHSVPAGGQPLPGGTGYPLGSTERFPRLRSHLFPLSQASPGAPGNSNGPIDRICLIRRCPCE